MKLIAFGHSCWALYMLLIYHLSIPYCIPNQHLISGRYTCRLPKQKQLRFNDGPMGLFDILRGRRPYVTPCRGGTSSQ